MKMGIRIQCLCTVIIACLLSPDNIYAVVKTSLLSGNWSNELIWQPSGVPGPADDVFISATNTVTVDADVGCHMLTVQSGGTLLWNPLKRLTISGAVNINGIATMSGGDITLTSPGLAFNLGPGARFTWEPGTNTYASATLFTRGTENFSATSTLIIRKWFDYTIPLANVITGNFGNVTMNSLGPSNTIIEWNQNNMFQSHNILGTLTVDQGWITLDKGGNISNTTIGAIVLTSINSSFYCHNGTHPSSFTLNTGSVSNTGGNFFGLNDGNGSVAVNVTGNFTNLGNVKIINNSGIAGVSNGDATFTVSGTFTQTTGDTRIIYNVTTTNSGIYHASFGSLILNGGIFMGQTGCHTGGDLCTLDIINDFTVNFSSPSDKFRGTSLTSIGQVLNNAQFRMIVNRNVTISGNSSSEMTSSASSGGETVTIGGNLTLNGSTMSFNYGASTASHNNNVTINGNLSVYNGALYFSRNGGNATIQVAGNTTVSGGTIALKSGTGPAAFTVSGRYSQSGGTVYLHNQSTELSQDPVSWTVNGDFLQTGGFIVFDDNADAQEAAHILKLQGPNCVFSGSGSISHAGAGTCPVFGLIQYGRQGTINLQRPSNSHIITQSKQQILNGCTLKISSGNLQVSSHSTQSSDFLRILPGGTLNTGNHQIVSGLAYAYSGVTVDSGGTIITQKPEGWYDGTPNGTLNSSGNMNFSLNAFSIVEYNGSTGQKLTGTVAGLSAVAEHEYGILRINYTGISGTSLSTLSNIYIRTRLELSSGLLALNGKSLILRNGASTGITRTNGGIISEDSSGTGNSQLVWMNLDGGAHVFPFSTESGTYIPVTITPKSGIPGVVKISTWKALTVTNLPYPAGLPSSTANQNGQLDASDRIIDRWWNINASPMTADVTVTYAGTENTLSSDYSTQQLGIMSWNGYGWSPVMGGGTGTILGTGTVTVFNTSNFSYWLVTGGNTTLPIELASFQASLEKDMVNISWITNSEINNEYFTVERSSDGASYESIARINGAGNSTYPRSYSTIDNNPLIGTSYYRLKQTDYDGKFSYSEPAIVHYSDVTTPGIRITEAGPNPFENHFRVNYESNEDGTATILLINLNGTILFQSDELIQKGNNVFEYSEGDHLARGTYILRISMGDVTEAKKLIKK